MQNFTHKSDFEACFGKSREHFIYPSRFANVFDLGQFEEVPDFFFFNDSESDRHAWVITIYLLGSLYSLLK